MLSIMSCNFVPALLKICCSFAEVALWTLCRGHLIIITVFFFRIFFSEGIKTDHFNLFAKRLKSNRPMQLNRKSGEYCIGMLPVFWMVINWWQKCLVAMTVIKVCLSQLINFVLRCIYLLFSILKNSVSRLWFRLCLHVNIKTIFKKTVRKKRSWHCWPKSIEPLGFSFDPYFLY